ncbi:PREDICTED: uncharacterized protein At5g39865-like isoform X2 [Tarenaya hassleriana]|uniref:uncharacterized protein At5g39865-like isoform X2 n=1 Tax=Tarenaya hassleriana TaxID=28532 RepID=UPI00053C79E7|nr:PREDICTED: uncharacterized protein At5g39865-like isoform X2 [Tarenaya hassleriana]
MWRPRGKSSPNYSPSFSFKDIHHLCTDDYSAFPPSSPKCPNRVFHRVRLASSVLRSWPSHRNQLPYIDSDPPDVRISLPGAENSIVLYFTSLRVVRSTFEECKAVRSILRAFRVRIDERDMSMDASFATELRRIFGEGKVQKLPRVFIGGRYVGGAEEVKQLHEMGELKKLVQGLLPAESGECEGCEGHGFVPCNDCHGSHKLYSVKLGFRSCSSCNENGLIRDCKREVY